MNNIDDLYETLLSLNLIDNKDSNEIRKLYSLSNQIENNYKVFKIKKHNGELRTICEPNYILKNIQRKILDNILIKKDISKYAKAYHKGISLKDNAECHVNKDLILKLDIKNFFDNISFYAIYKSCFQDYPKNIGMLLTYLCTYYNVLPQGAPTSAYISNLVMKAFDEKLGVWCEENNISYTRYSDDMTFSGNFNPSIVIIRVRKMLGKLGLKLNDKKIAVIGKNKQQLVTGIVVNEHMQVPSNYRKKIRQEIYFIKKYGLEEHLKRVKLDNKKEYLLNLYGRILYAISINQYDKQLKVYKKYVGEFIKIVR